MALLLAIILWLLLAILVLVGSVLITPIFIRMHLTTTPQFAYRVEVRVFAGLAPRLTLAAGPSNGGCSRHSVRAVCPGLAICVARVWTAPMTVSLDPIITVGPLRIAAISKRKVSSLHHGGGILFRAKTPCRISDHARYDLDRLWTRRQTNDMRADRRPVPRRVAHCFGDALTHGPKIQPL